MQNFSRGDLCPVAWINTDGFTVLNIKGWNQDIEVALWDRSHIANGGNTSRLGGRGDASATVVADVDLDQLPTDDPPKIVPGQPGLVICYIAPARWLTMPMRVEKLHFSSTTETAVGYVFDAKMDADTAAIVLPQAVIPSGQIIPPWFERAQQSEPSTIEAQAIIVNVLAFLRSLSPAP